eukprot:8343004-Pyramimonas_sp.AAC.1
MLKGGPGRWNPTGRGGCGIQEILKSIGEQVAAQAFHCGGVVLTTDGGELDLQRGPAHAPTSVG